MKCDDKNNLLVKSDFDCIGEIATHCDLPKLCIAGSESALFDMENIFCDVWIQIREIYREVLEYQTALAECEADPDCVIPPIEPDNYDDKLNLICGGTFTGCGDRVLEHQGIRLIWVYYAYSRYLILNGFNDTPNGNVIKTNDFSVPRPYNEVKDFADKYRTMAYEAFKKTSQYLKRSTLVTWNQCGCGKCSSTKAQGYGFKSSVISKRL